MCCVLGRPLHRSTPWPACCRRRSGATLNLLPGPPVQGSGQALASALGHLQTTTPCPQVASGDWCLLPKGSRPQRAQKPHASRQTRSLLCPLPTQAPFLVSSAAAIGARLLHPLPTRRRRQLPPPAAAPAVHQPWQRRAITARMPTCWALACGWARTCRWDQDDSPDGAPGWRRLRLTTALPVPAFLHLQP